LRDAAKMFQELHESLRNGQMYRTEDHEDLLDNLRKPPQAVTRLRSAP
jgi:hypothetical protein